MTEQVERGFEVAVEEVKLRLVPLWIALHLGLQRGEAQLLGPPPRGRVRLGGDQLRRQGSRLHLRAPQGRTERAYPDTLQRGRRPRAARTGEERSGEAKGGGEENKMAVNDLIIEPQLK